MNLYLYIYTTGFYFRKKYHFYFHSYYSFYFVPSPIRKFGNYFNMENIHPDDYGTLTYWPPYWSDFHICLPFIPVFMSDKLRSKFPYRWVRYILLTHRQSWETGRQKLRNSNSSFFWPFSLFNETQSSSSPCVGGRVPCKAPKYRQQIRFVRLVIELGTQTSLSLWLRVTLLFKQ